MIRDANLDDFDTIVSISGDGLLFEIVNALGVRPDADQALRKPIAVVPGGSGNGLACSLGNAKSLDAVLNLTQGLYRPLDLNVVEQPETNTRKLSFLFVTWGFLSDVDFEVCLYSYTIVCQ